MTGGSHTLPFDKLAPGEFERLCLWLVQREGYMLAEHLGEAGSERGRDVVAWKHDRRVVFQCKRVKAFTAATARVEIAKLRGLPILEQPHELVFVVSQAVSAEAREATRTAWGDEDTCQFWAGDELDEKAKRHPDILKEFFQLPGFQWPSLKKAAKRVTDLAFLMQRRWRLSVAIALMIGAVIFYGLWWTVYLPARLYDRGLQAMATRDFPRALISFEEALAKKDRPVVRSALAETLMRLGKNDRALEEAELSLKQSAQLPYQDRLLVQARHARISGQWDEALLRYKLLQEKKPAEVEYAVGIAEAQIAQYQYTDALSTIQAMQKTYADPRLDLAEGMAAYYLSDFSRLIESTSRAIKRAEKQGSDLLASEGYLLRGNAFLSLGKLKNAGNDFKIAEIKSKRNLEQVAIARNAIARALSLQGNFKDALDHYDGAREAYRQAGDAGSANAQKLYIADIYDLQGKLGLARQEYEEALDQPGNLLSQPDQADARACLGTVLARQGELIKATENLERAISLFGNMGDEEKKAGYSCRLSIVQLDSLELAPAKRSLKGCLITERKDDLFLKADVLFSQGYLHSFQGDLELSRKEYQEALKTYTEIGALGQVALSQLELAGIELERNQPLAANSLAQSALNHFSEERALDDLATAQVYLAKISLIQGAPRRALNTIDDVKRRESESLALRVHTSLVEALALADLGKIEEARQVIQNQLNNDGNRRHPRLRMETRLAQGEIEVLHGDRNQGRGLLSLVEDDARERGFKLVETKAARLRAGS